jgi:hypothetical protein
MARESKRLVRPRPKNKVNFFQLDEAFYHEVVFVSSKATY